MKKSLFALGAAALLMTACGKSDKYSIEVSVPEALQGQTIAVLNAQNGDTLGSAVATDSLLTISGTVKAPVMAIVSAQGMPMFQLVLEPGKISFNDEGLATGTKSNDAFAAYADEITPIMESLRNTTDENESESILKDQFVPAAVKFINANHNNPYNTAVFGSVAPFLSEAQLKTVFEADTAIANNPDAQHVMANAVNKAKTSAGSKYVDLTIAQEDSTLVKLSDYIVPGRFTLVDFWASWCRPCRQEIPALISLYNKYKDAGLDVVGVAVWDRVPDTKKAIEELGINYPVILNGNRETTDAYGIMGIPCIMLIDPQGVIIARDLFGQNLIDTVDQAIASKRR
ncbi:MAG: AhpC/TSA family protein [Muribaculaceae bacterium]|nr:AhpC/TSA family protein [Muribaculaceae bacterium]